MGCKGSAGNLRVRTPRIPGSNPEGEVVASALLLAPGVAPEHPGAMLRKVPVEAQSRIGVTDQYATRAMCVAIDAVRRAARKSRSSPMYCQPPGDAKRRHYTPSIPTAHTPPAPTPRGM